MITISFINMKGGVAKTTLAINVADTLTRRHNKKVLLVDVDPQFNATQCLMSGEKYVEKIKAGDPTVYQIFDDSNRPIVSAVGKNDSKTSATALKNIKPWAIKDRLDMLPGDLELYRLDFVPGQGRERRLKRYLEESGADDKYDFVLIDTPPTPSAWMSSALLASDYYLVPVKPEPLSFTGIDLLKSVVDRFCENYGKELSCLGVVLTMAESALRVYSQTKDYLKENKHWKDKGFKNDLPKRTEIAREQTNQRLILDLQDVSAQRPIAGITQEILERINDNGARKKTSTKKSSH